MSTQLRHTVIPVQHNMPQCYTVIMAEITTKRAKPVLVHDCHVPIRKRSTDDGQVLEVSEERTDAPGV